jgi:hypothetical protein
MVTLVQNAPADSFQQLVQQIPYASSSGFSLLGSQKKMFPLRGDQANTYGSAMKAGASPTAWEELCPSARRYTHAGVR